MLNQKFKQYIFAILPEEGAPMQFFKKIYGSGLTLYRFFSKRVFGAKKEQKAQLAFLHTYLKPGMRVLDTEGPKSFFSRSAKALYKDVVITTITDAGVDMMKVNLKGGELPFFQKAEKYLSGPNAPIILYVSSSTLTQAFSYHPVETLWFLESLGYQFLNRPLRQYDGLIIATK